MLFLTYILSVLSARFQLENWSAPSRLGSELSQLELAWKDISKINWPLQCGSFFRVFQFLRFAYYRWQWNSGILQEFQSKSRWLHLSGTYEKSGKHNYLLTVCKNRLSHEDLLRTLQMFYIVWIKTNNNNKMAIWWLFLAIFLPTVCLSFTKPRLKRSFRGAQWV